MGWDAILQNEAYILHPWPSHGIASPVDRTQWSGNQGASLLINSLNVPDGTTVLCNSTT